MKKLLAKYIFKAAVSFIGKFLKDFKFCIAKEELFFDSSSDRNRYNLNPTNIINSNVYEDGWIDPYNPLTQKLQNRL